MDKQLVFMLVFGAPVVVMAIFAEITMRWPFKK